MKDNWKLFDPKAGEDKAAWNEAEIKAFAFHLANATAADFALKVKDKDGERDLKKQIEASLVEQAPHALTFFRTHNLMEGVREEMLAAEKLAAPKLPEAPIAPKVVADPADADPNLVISSVGSAPLPAFGPSLSPPGAEADVKTADATPVDPAADAKPAEAAPEQDPVAKAAADKAQAERMAALAQHQPNWAAIPHIFRTNDEDIKRIDEAHNNNKAAKGTPHNIIRTVVPAGKDAAGNPTKPYVVYDNANPLNAHTMAYISARYGAQERSPFFLQAVRELALLNGVTPEEMLGTVDNASTRMDKVSVISGNPPTESKENLNDALFLQMQRTSLLFNSNRNPDYAFTHIGLIQKSWIEEKVEQLRGHVSSNGLSPQFQHAGIMLVDKSNNAYFDTGRKSTVYLAPGEKFKAEHGLNIAAMYIENRHDPRVPQQLQNLRFEVTSGKKLVGGVNSDTNYKNSANLMGVLIQCKKLGVTPTNIHVEKALSLHLLEHIYTKDQKKNFAGSNAFILHPLVREELTLMGYDVDGMVKEFNGQMAALKVDKNGASIGGTSIKETPADLTQAAQGVPVAPRKEPQLHDTATFKAAELARAPLGKLIETVIGEDMTGPIKKAGDFQAELRSLDVLLSSNTNGVQPFDKDKREQILNIYLNDFAKGEAIFNKIYGEEAFKNAFAPENLKSHQDHVNIMKGLGADSAVPAFGAIMEAMLVNVGIEGQKFNPGMARGVIETATLLQAAARTIQIVGQKKLPADGDKFPVMRAGQKDSHNLQAVTSGMNRLQESFHAGTLDAKAIAYNAQEVAPRLIQAATGNLRQMGAGALATQMEQDLTTALEKTQGVDPAARATAANRAPHINITPGPRHHAPV